MESAIGLNVKQPEPKLSQETSKVSKNKTAATQPQTIRQYKAPKVGVIDVPKISRTPLNDTIEIQKKETPRTRYKIEPSRGKLPKFQTFLTINAIIFGIIALFNLKK